MAQVHPRIVRQIKESISSNVPRTPQRHPEGISVLDCPKFHREKTFVNTDSHFLSELDEVRLPRREGHVNKCKNIDCIDLYVHRGGRANGRCKK